MLGGVVGCFVSVFLSLPADGVREVLVLAGCSAVCLGALALWLSPAIAPPKDKPRTQSRRRSHPVDDAQALMSRKFGLVLITVGAAWCSSFACMVLLRSVLVYTVTPSLYSSAMILITSLGGIAVGICLSARLIVPRLRSAILWFGLVQMPASLGIVASVWLLALLPGLDEGVFAPLVRRGGWCFLVARFAGTFAVMFVPTLLMGAALAITMTVCLRDNAAEGRRIGHVQAAGVIGALLGWLVAAFVLLPALGALNGLFSVIALNLAMGALLIGIGSAWSVRAFAGATLAAAVVVGSLAAISADIFDDTFAINHDLGKLLWIKAGPSGTLAVRELAAGERVLAVDGIGLSESGLAFRATKMLQSYIPLCFHRDPKRILQIGPACAQTAREPEFPVHGCTIIEPLASDGKSYARLSRETFDIIVNDAVAPGPPGGSSLLTVEHFMNCRRRLRPGGLLSCRIPLDLPPSELCMILAGFRDVFPHASVWLASNSVNRHCVLLGSLSPLRIDFKHVSAVVHRSAISNGLAEIEIHDVYDLLDCHVCDEDAVSEIIGRFERNAGNQPARHTDNLPLLELSAASRTYSEVYKKQSLSILATHHGPVTRYVMNFADEEYDRAEIARRFEATRHVLSAHICELSGLPGQRSSSLAAALKANPGEAAVRNYQAELNRQIQALQQAVAKMLHKDALAEHLADKLFIASRYPEADAIYMRLIAKKCPPSPNTFVNLAGIRFTDGNLAEAEGLLRRCLDRWPGSAEAHDRLGGIYFRMGRLNAARYHAGQALRIEPTNALYLQHYDHATRGPKRNHADEESDKGR